MPDKAAFGLLGKWYFFPAQIKRQVYISSTGIFWDRLPDKPPLLESLSQVAFLGKLQLDIKSQGGWHLICSWGASKRQGYHWVCKAAEKVAGGTYIKNAEDSKDSW